MDDEKGIPKDPLEADAAAADEPAVKEDPKDETSSAVDVIAKSENVVEGQEPAAKGEIPDNKDGASVVEKADDDPAVPGTTPKAARRAAMVEAVAHIRSTFNNTLVTISDLSGRTLCWSSAGLVGFKGARKGTPYAASLASEDAAKKAQEKGVKRVRAHVRGPGAGREAAVRGLQTAGLEVTLIRDVTPVPHNGCRPPKRRRV